MSCIFLFENNFQWIITISSYVMKKHPKQILIFRWVGEGKVPCSKLFQIKHCFQGPKFSKRNTTFTTRWNRIRIWFQLLNMNRRQSPSKTKIYQKIWVLDCSTHEVLETAFIDRNISWARHWNSQSNAFTRYKSKNPNQMLSLKNVGMVVKRKKQQP